MLLTLKISCTLLLLGSIQFANSFPQFSIPFVAWNKNKEDPSKLTLQFNIQNPFPSFGKNRQYEKSRRNNEVILDEKIVTDANYDRLTTQDPKIWGIFEEKIPSQSNVDMKENKPNVENRNAFKENENTQVKLDVTDDDTRINKIFGYDDSTTESTTEYETTTDEDFSDLYRSGVSSQVVATLLG